MIKYILRLNVIPMIASVLALFILPVDPAVAIFSGFFLSLIFIVGNAWVIDQFWDADSNTFMKVFFFSMAVRFVLVLAAMGILLGLTKIDEIYFTVSFIISYLYQSVTEMIFINKILQQRSSQK